MAATTVRTRQGPARSTALREQELALLFLLNGFLAGAMTLQSFIFSEEKYEGLGGHGLDLTT